MKITVTLKDPDGFYDAVQQAAVADTKQSTGLNKKAMDMLIECRRETLFEQLQKWVDSDEYIDIEFDLDAGTAKVIERQR